MSKYIRIRCSIKAFFGTCRRNNIIYNIIVTLVFNKLIKPQYSLLRTQIFYKYIFFKVFQSWKYVLFIATSKSGNPRLGRYTKYSTLKHTHNNKGNADREIIFQIKFFQVSILFQSKTENTKHAQIYWKNVAHKTELVLKMEHSHQISWFWVLFNWSNISSQHIFRRNCGWRKDLRKSWRNIKSLLFEILCVIVYFFYF